MNQRPPASGDRRPPRRPRRAQLDPARRAAFDVLRAVSERDAYANLALPALLAERGINGRDAAFATELTYGACRTRGLLDAVIAAAAGRPIDQIDPVLLDLLRLGAYQLLRTNVAQHAAVSTTVEQAGVEFDTARAGFVNAVMRRIAGRDENSWVAELAPSADTDPVGHIAFVHAHPRWIAQAFADALGADAGELDAALAADDARPAVHLAARPGVLTAAELAEEVGGTPGRYSPYAVYLSGGDPGRLAPVRDARALVQDEGSQLVARALVLAPVTGVDEGRWLDLCAGPGGKTALIAALAAQQSATVTAVEPNPRRAEMVEQQHPRPRGAGASCRWPRTTAADGRFRPGAGGCPLHRPRRAAAPPGGALAPHPGRRPRAGQAATRTARLGDPAGPTRWGGASTRPAHRTWPRPSASVSDATRRHPVTVLDARALFAPAGDLGAGPLVQLWPHRHGTDAMFAAVLRKDG